MTGRPCPTLRATSLSLQEEPADIGKGLFRPALVAGDKELCTRSCSNKHTGDRIGMPETFAKAEAEACPTGRPVSKERLGDWDGVMEV
jgi:hypothetical protein